MGQLLSSRRLTLMAGAFLVALSVFSFVPLQKTYAEDPDESMTLSPAKKNYSVNPGQTFNDTLTVLNDGKTAYDFIVYATPYSVQNSNYDPDFTTNTPNGDAYTWVQFEQTTYHAEPRQTITVPFTVHVKDTAAPGGHYGALFAEIKSSDSSQQAGVAVRKRVGALLYATVSGNVHLAGQATTTTIGWLQSRPPLTASSSVKNTGNTDFSAKVALTVKNVFGVVQYTNQQDYAVLPGTTRDIPLSWANAGWFGLYHVSVATTVLGNTITHSSYVLMMPLWLILLVLVLALAGGFYAYFTQQKKQKKTTEKHTTAA